MAHNDQEQTVSPDVDELLRNAELRDELEPLYDDSIGWVNVAGMSTHVENEFLASMLEWERAPIVPVSQWFTPELVLPHPDTLDDERLREKLGETVQMLFEKRIVLDFTDHLTDRQLYCMIYRDILPSHEKKLEREHNYLHWDCANAGGNPEVWLRYYASDEDREMWVAEMDGPLPPRQQPPYRRELPRAPL